MGLACLLLGLSVSGCVRVKKSLLEPNKTVKVIWDIKFDIYDRNPKTAHMCPRDVLGLPALQQVKRGKGSSASSTKQAPVSAKKTNKKPPKYVVSSSELLGAMESSATSTFTAATRFVGKYRQYDRQIVEADVRRLKKLYRNFGFFRTKVFPFDPKIDLRILAQNNAYREFQRVQIRVRICEGPQAQIRKRLISWTPKQPEIKELLEKLPLKPNDRFTTSNYNELKSELSSRLQKNSYVLNRVKGVARPALG